MSIFKRVLSVGSGKLVSELNDVVQDINDKEKEFELFSDEEIKLNFQELSKKLNGDPQSIEVEAFA
ncbi:MAG: preprotein translocase SecA, partial [Proteobacteria bacterium]|nr:preprotein translocase SecA [Pseudomonadota bacterium]